MFSEATLPETRQRAIHGVIRAKVDGDVDIARVAEKKNNKTTRHDNGNCFFNRSAVATVLDPLNVALFPLVSPLCANGIKALTK